LSAKSPRPAETPPILLATGLGGVEQEGTQVRIKEVLVIGMCIFVVLVPVQYVVALPPLREVVAVAVAGMRRKEGAELVFTEKVAAVRQGVMAGLAEPMELPMLVEFTEEAEQAQATELAEAPEVLH